MVKVLIDFRFPSICSASDVLPVGGPGSLQAGLANSYQGGAALR